MTALRLKSFHESLGATFTAVNGMETVAGYGDFLAEHAALTQGAAVLDLSCRGRICLTGADRVRFLNGQVTNNVKALATGQGCYAALVTAKGKMESDLNIYALADELLLDFEPGYTHKIVQRLKGFIIADDCEVVDVGALYNLFSLQGPKAPEIVTSLGLLPSLPDKPFHWARIAKANWGESYCIYNPRCAQPGYDFFVPAAESLNIAQELWAATRAGGGRPAGWLALEAARIEAGIPRYGQDADDTNLAPETGLETRAISYSKGCYIGQEVIARIRTYGQVTRTLRGLSLDPATKILPSRGEKLLHAGKEVGYVTSALHSPTWQRPIALGYVRREHHAPGTIVTLASAHGESPVRVVSLPFQAAELNH